MLSQFNPLTFQHRSLADGALLRAPEERSHGVGIFWYHR
jgi:hypothetical protein